MSLLIPCDMIYNVYAIFFRVVGVWVGGLVGRISNSISCLPSPVGEAKAFRN